MLPGLRTQLDALIEKRDRFQRDLQALSEQQLRYRPAPDAWSFAEVAQHLLQVEREVTKAARKPGVERRGRRRNAREWIGFGAFQSIVHLNLRIKIPQKVAGLVTPADNPDMKVLWSEWAKVHEDLAIYLEPLREESLHEMAFGHPIMGPTPVRGVLPFLHRHFDHHMRQVGRIRRSAGFPAA